LIEKHLLMRRAIAGAREVVRSTRRVGPLAAGVAAALLLGAACTGHPGSERLPRSASARSTGERAADILEHAIRFVTVNPPGDEQPLAEYFVGLLREAGIEAASIETPPGNSRRGRAAAWGRLRGAGRRPPIVLLSHLDVVPADAEDWTTDPFAGTRVDGYVVGRGAIDAKGVAVVHLLTLTELARRGVKLDRDVVFLSTPDEETGGEQGAGYLVRERPDLLEGAAYLLTEGGRILVRDEDQRQVWGVAVTEKSPCWLRLVSRGSPGHGSVPPRDAAVPRLIAALERVQSLEMPVRVVPEVADMFADLAPVAPPEDRQGLADLNAALETDSAFRSRFLANRERAALVRDTLTTTVIRGGSGTNVVPPVATANLDARLLPGESCADFTDQIRSILADPGIEVEPLLSFPSRGSSPDTPLFRAIERVAVAGDPRSVVVPRVIPGFTDAHHFRELGVTAYGFVPRAYSTDDLRGVHGPDERISIANLERGVATLIAILEEIDRVEAEESP
jgi:acetylornithine deacetylase/succinyl-diaminopimelate desuccinylase-like protein